MSQHDCVCRLLVILAPCQPYPALGIAVVGLLGLGLLYAAIRVGQRALRSDRQRLPLLTGALFGLGICGLLIAGSGFRHFGGFTQVGQGATAYRCDAWWVQMRSSAGATDGDDLPSRECRQAATRAVMPAIRESLLIGAAGAVVGYTFVIVRRRHFDRGRREVATRSS
jgi:hypothetical protein